VIVMSLKFRLLKALPKIEQYYPKCRWIFLTLTLCSYSGECSTDLSATLMHMNKSWQRLVRRREFYRVVLGWVRIISFHQCNGIIYPYCRVLLLVSPEYFGRWYVSNWGEIWRQCAKLNYTPVVDTRVVVDCGEFVKTMECAVSSEDLKDSEWVMKLSEQVSKNKLTSTGGVLRRLLRE
jgi:hypothetical protein